MNQLHYASTYQLSRLFIQYALGRVQDPIVANSLQSYLISLHEALSGEESLSPVEDALRDYFKQETYDKRDFQKLMDHLDVIEKLYQSSGVDVLMQYFRRVLESVLPVVPKPPASSSSELVHYFASTGYCADMTLLQQHEMYTFTKGKWTGHILIPLSSGASIDWTKHDTPVWFEEIVTKTKEIVHQLKASTEEDFLQP